MTLVKIPYGVYKCPECGKEFEVCSGLKVLCPGCGKDITDKAAIPLDPLTEAARRGFESVQHKD